MSYEAGMVKIRGPNVEEDDEYLLPRDVEIGEVYLPHSCEHWVIGGAAEVRQMIADLTGLLATDEVKT